jgi:DNA-binding SARP family transcriptional activator
MEFRILGPLEVWDERGEVSLAGPKPRALLALLLLHPNEVVPADRLIDELWGEDSPERAAAALRVNVSRLRKSLAQDVLTTRSPGYVIRVGPDELDLHRFERLVEEGRSLLARGLAADASERLRDALSLWRGPALADFAYENFARTAIARLEEIRLAAVELRIDADLALGRHDELVGELEALVAEHPLRERLRTCLMTALYRSGRQAEALDAYQAARRALVGELGIEPSPALQELERAILRQDPSLDVEAPARLREVAERSILVAITHETHVEALLALSEPLVRNPPRVLILARLVSDAAELRSASAWLEERRSALEERGVVARATSFTSTAPGEELARLATELDVELLLANAPDELLAEGAPDEQLTALLAGTPCDVALLVSRGAPPEGPVLVPFGGAEHDWAAVELGAWFARAAEAPLRLAGAAAVPEQGRRDASRLLSHGALAVQRVLGISAEPLLTPPGEEGMLEASRDAGLLVVGLSTRWHREGLGSARLRLAREAIPPTLLVRRGLRPGGLAPPASLTRFTWSIRP